jgi:hypothetical protein
MFFVKKTGNKVNLFVKIDENGNSIRQKVKISSIKRENDMQIIDYLKLNL